MANDEMEKARAAARVFYTTRIDPNADDPIMYKYMADFAMEYAASIATKSQPASDEKAKDYCEDAYQHVREEWKRDTRDAVMPDRDSFEAGWNARSEAEPISDELQKAIENVRHMRNYPALSEKWERDALDTVLAAAARSEAGAVVENHKVLSAKEIEVTKNQDNINRPADEAPIATPDARDIARKFHNAYERLAPAFGYETRSDTKVFDPASDNGRLMIAVIGEVVISNLVEVESMKTELSSLRADRDDLQRCFDMHYAAEMRGIERWRAEKPEERKLRSPDTSNFTVWLLDRLEFDEQIFAELKETNEALADSHTALDSQVSRLSLEIDRLNTELQDRNTKITALLEAANAVVRVYENDRPELAGIAKVHRDLVAAIKQADPCVQQSNGGSGLWSKNKSLERGLGEQK